MLKYFNYFFVKEVNLRIQLLRDFQLSWGLSETCSHEVWVQPAPSLPAPPCWEKFWCWIHSVLTEDWVLLRPCPWWPLHCCVGPPKNLVSCLGQYILNGQWRQCPEERRESSIHRKLLIEKFFIGLPYCRRANSLSHDGWRRGGGASGALWRGLKQDWAFAGSPDFQFI